SLSALKKAKNTIIGNPTAKHAMANDEALVDFINNPPLILEDPSSSQDDIRIEAAHVIASLSYGSEGALKTLMRYNAHQAFVYAIVSFRPPESPKFRAAFARALPQLLANAIRVPIHHVAVSDWLPVADRLKEVKGKRAWEKPGLSSSSSRRNGRVMRSLIALLQKKDIKSQEAALSALAYLAKDNPQVASKLTKAILDREAPLSQVLTYCTSRCTDLQLAACLWQV
ncbi:uncharacterized protein LAESUDRAFT_623838, partial [Laetiporus sulphureus 93-53]